jgi:hypothetical protein
LNAEASKSETAWRAGRLTSSTGRHRLLFGQMHEDADIECHAFRGMGRIFCIASAGDTAMRLSLEHQVVACDINPVQLAYAERRAAGAPTATGDAERVMQILRTFMPVVGWRIEAVRTFLALSNTTEQIAFWQAHLNTRRFRTAFDTLMSRPALRIIYARQFLSFLPANFGVIMRRRLERGFALHANASNPYIHALLLGETPGAPQLNRANLQFVLGDAASILESCAPASFAGFTLSNILDGAAPSYRQRLARAMHRTATPDALVVSRSFAEPSAPTATNHPERDRSMLWGTVDIRLTHLF